MNKKESTLTKVTLEVSKKIGDINDKIRKDSASKLPFMYRPVKSK